MKTLTSCAIALLALFATVSAQAAIIIQVDVVATGATTTRTIVANPYSDITKVDPKSMAFSFQIDIPDFVNGTSSFSFGDPRASGLKSGTILDLGSGNLTGTNFHYFENIQDGRGCSGDCVISSTTLDAATFSVRQLVPSPVPEPATWAMMIIGFGLVGGAMRRRHSLTVTYA